MKQRSIKDKLNSLHVSIQQMETDPDYRKGQPVSGRIAGNYVDNLHAHVRELKDVSKEVGQLEWAAGMLEKAASKGDVSAQHFGQVIKMLRAIEKGIKRDARKVREDTDALGELLEGLQVEAGLVEAKAVRGKAQKFVMKALQDLGGEAELTSLARHPGGRGIHFAQIMKSVEALAKVGHVSFNPQTQMIKLRQDESITEARKAVKRSKSRAIVDVMDKVKDYLTGAGWKHRQMGNADTYTRRVSDKEKAINFVTAALKANGLVGYHNKVEQDGLTEYHFEHRRYRKLVATLEDWHDTPEMVLRVQDLA